MYSELRAKYGRFNAAMRIRKTEGGFNAALLILSMIIRIYPEVFLKCKSAVVYLSSKVCS